MEQFLWLFAGWLSGIVTTIIVLVLMVLRRSDVRKSRVLTLVGKFSDGSGLNSVLDMGENVVVVKKDGDGNVTSRTHG